MSSSPFLLITFTFLVLICETIQAQTNGRLLPKEEKNALKEIADQLGKKDWNFNVNPCDESTNWTTPGTDNNSIYVNNVTCNCSTSDGFCHVQIMLIRGQDLPGVLPASLAKLPYLKTIDLNRNYLSGTIPTEWASTKLENMKISNNRLSGPIPDYIGNMTSLVNVSLETNFFNGSLPAEMGKLVNLEMLLLNANNFTGEWPVELNNLTKLTVLKISSNSFVGELPNFGSLKKLKNLEIQGSGFEGPIPRSISVLTRLDDLRISDLNGGASEFPPLRNMINMTKLILRSCNIHGQIPDFVANMSDLKYLDLSFNKLEGGIGNLERLTNLSGTYLTGNSFVGRIPEWLTSRDTRNVIDLSYNKFNESSEPSTCRDNLNLYRSFKAGNFVEHGMCLSPCSEEKYSLHINCGGGKVTIGNTTYEEDEDSAGSAKFFYKKENWGASSTGHFWDRNISLSNYKVDNVSAIKGDKSQLYMTARLSPLSLTYFARCLANGSYTLTLHFAEIVYRDNRSFQSLGERIFDVYVQDKLKLKDFDIERVAGGVDKAWEEKFNVTVKDKTVEVRFQYAGKGTTSIPSRGSYGPLVSAISLEANFKPLPTQKTSSNWKRKILIVAGAVISSLALILIILFVAWRIRRNRKLMEQELRGLDLQTGIFTFRQIKAATSNFDAANKLGEGGFGSVYKGTLADGTIVAVKQLSSKSRQGNREFVNEIGMISSLRHPNLVRLYGCCVERKQLLLIYEYMENNSLSHALFGPEECRPKLDWPTRQKICVGIAKGLAFLHEESPLKIVHRDIKPTNVLLDKDLNPRISDFGLAKLYEEGKTHITTRVAAGTRGYIAPEYALWGYLTYKADLYSFGVVVLELIAGKKNMKYHPDENYIFLLDLALVLQKEGKSLELLDPRLGSDFNKEEALRMIKVALLCTSTSPAMRPNMSVVVNMLEGRLDIDESNLDSSVYDDEINFQGRRDKYDEMQVNSSDNQLHVRSTDTKDTDRSSSTFPSTSTS
ncbi:hypothetical protein K7X08_033124 [Anisodus acutangulus]|uniref:non-specific serine/threonine protein kinase n=1 Tax=Anisodus acutangulus TaxID=402998 RepID=A0A9Q1M2M1_9SOLA|nr:hypothetical protein K7X08_033124 [Anisodus acutangulus]